MKLDPNCMRDVLLQIEEYDNMDIHMRVDNLIDKIGDRYTRDQLEYTCLKLHEGHFVELTTFNVLGTDRKVIIDITGLTWDGHQFLESIRPKPIWDKILESAKNGGLSLTIDIIKMLAEHISQECAKKFIKK